MSNSPIAPLRRPNRSTLAVGAVMAALLGVATTVVPSPMAVVDGVVEMVGGSATPGRSGVLRGTTTMSTRVDLTLQWICGALVWLIVAWVAAVLALTLLVRVSGSRGRLAHRVLALVTPARLRTALITAVGVGAVASVTACAPLAAAESAGSSGAATGGSAATVQMDGTATGAGSEAGWSDWPAGGSGDPTAADVQSSDAEPGRLAVIDLDWPARPVVAPPSTLSDLPVDPSSSAPALEAETSAPTLVPTGTTESTGSTAVGDAAAVPETTSEPTTETTAAPIPRSPVTGVDSPPAAPVDAPSDSSGTPSGITPPAAPLVDASVSPTPSAPTPTQAPTPTPTPTPPAPQAATVTVQRGDSLWTIAAAHLPTGASATDIGASWPRWYQTNLAVIGDDPNLIQPGWQLVIPDQTGATFR